MINQYKKYSRSFNDLFVSIVENNALQSTPLVFINCMNVTWESYNI
jgi:hypothetical protein